MPPVSRRRGAGREAGREGSGTSGTRGRARRCRHRVSPAAAGAAPGPHARRRRRHRPTRTQQGRAARASRRRPVRAPAPRVEIAPPRRAGRRRQRQRPAAAGGAAAVTQGRRRRWRRRGLAAGAAASPSRGRVRARFASAWHSAGCSAHGARVIRQRAAAQAALSAAASPPRLSKSCRRSGADAIAAAGRRAAAAASRAVAQDQRAQEARRHRVGPEADARRRGRPAPPPRPRGAAPRRGPSAGRRGVAGRRRAAPAARCRPWPRRPGWPRVLADAAGDQRGRGAPRCAWTVARHSEQGDSRRKGQSAPHAVVSHRRRSIALRTAPCQPRQGADGGGWRPRRARRPNGGSRGGREGELLAAMEEHGQRMGRGPSPARAPHRPARESRASALVDLDDVGQQLQRLVAAGAGRCCGR